MAHRVERHPRNRRAPLGVAAALLLLSVAVNFGVVRGAVELVEAEPWEDEAEELLMVDLTEPELAEPEPPDDPEDPEEPEPPEPELEQPEPEFELIEPEPPPEEPEPEPEPAPEEEKPPELEPIPQNMKMVEQLDELDDQQTNEDADYLSNIDRKVTEQTQSEITNLEQDALEAKARQLEDSDKPEIGTANEDVIAQAETQRSANVKQAPKVKTEQRELRPEQNDPDPKSMLATRDLEPREHSEAMEAQEDLAVEAEDGVVAIAQEESSTVLEQDQNAKTNHRDQRYAFRLSHEEMDAVFGHDHNAPKNTESLETSKNDGVWDAAREAYQSPLENFVPEVKPGNQTALNSRKHPFARYIATMHRGIHEAWGFGYLEALDNHGASHPLNDMGLWTRVEIVLASDGTVEKVKTVRHSGNSSFDAAAREVVFSTGPYPNPPKSIRSGNGKIYIHWAFHRDERACGTFGAQPFILDNAGEGERPDVEVEVVIRGGGGGGVPEGPRAMAPRQPSALANARGDDETESLERHGEGAGASPGPSAGKSSGVATAPGTNGPGGLGSGQAGTPGHGHPGGHAQPGAGGGGGQPGAVPRGGSGGGGGATTVPRPSVPRPSVPGVGTAGSRPGKSSGGSGGGGLLSGGRTSSKPAKSAEGPAPADDESGVDPVATAIAKNWIRAFTKGEVTTMVNRSSVPFRSGSSIAAKNKEELAGLLEALADEVKGKKAKHDGTYTAAQLRKKFGSVPAGVQEGEGRVYAVFEIAGDSVILMMQKRYGSWRVMGVTR